MLSPKSALFFAFSAQLARLLGFEALAFSLEESAVICFPPAALLRLFRGSDEPGDGPG